MDDQSYQQKFDRTDQLARDYILAHYIQALKDGDFDHADWIVHMAQQDLDLVELLRNVRAIWETRSSFFQHCLRPSVFVTPAFDQETLSLPTVGDAIACLQLWETARWSSHKEIRHMIEQLHLSTQPLPQETIDERWFEEVCKREHVQTNKAFTRRFCFMASLLVHIWRQGVGYLQNRYFEENMSSDEKSEQSADQPFGREYTK